MKRALDIIVSATGLLLLLPLLLILALLVRLTSNGPALFRQQRVGLGGKPFTMLKFRSMTVRDDAQKGSFDAGDDTRVTRIGRFLRKTKLDELPQLWNVMKGDMSIVGPRPEVPKWTEVYPKRWEKVLQVRPGITDPASIEFRNEEELLAASDDPEATYRNTILPRKLELYEQYIADNTAWTDASILLRTMLAVLLLGKK